MTEDTTQTRDLFDFADGADLEDWTCVNDTVMGGVSRSRIVQGTEGTMIFKGEISLENYGGFASIRSTTEALDIGGCDSIAIRAKGDGKTYKLMARMNNRLDSISYQAAFETEKNQWKTYSFRLEDFTASFRGRKVPDAPPLDPKKVKTIGFLISDKQEGPFALEVRWIKAARNE